MLTRDQLIQRALVTQDPGVLFSLLEQALELAKFEASRGDIARAREAKLNAQISRQVQMIDNLEKTKFFRK